MLHTGYQWWPSHAPWTCKQVVDSAALMMCKYGTNEWQEGNIAPSEYLTSLLEEFIFRENPESYTHLPLLTDEIWGWINKYFIYERFSIVFLLVNDNDNITIVKILISNVNAIKEFFY